MSKRTSSEMKKVSSMLSSFNVRAVSVTAKLNSEEKDLYQWLGVPSKESTSDIVFSDKNVEAYLSDLSSLQPQQYVTAGVLNVWACHLNYQEWLRSIDSPSRFFFTTFPTGLTLVDTPADWSPEYAKEIFWGRIEADMEVIRDFNIGNIDMVFFPICHTGDFFIVVLDFKRKVNILLDNLSSLEDEPLSVKYGVIPTNVTRAFCEWLINHEFVVRGRTLINLPVRRLKLPWSNEKNKADSGVYAMRHMETFMGGGAHKGLECWFGS